MSKKTSSNKLVLYNTLSTIMLYATTFFSAPVFSRLLGADEYGVVQVYNTWASILAVILGLFTRGTLAIAKVYFDEDDFIEYQSSTLFLSLVSFLIGLIIILIISPLLTNLLGLGLGYLILVAVHGFSMYCVQFMNTKLTYEMRAKENLKLSVLIALANFCLSFVLIKNLPMEHLYTGRMLGMALPYIVAAISIVANILRRGKTFYNKIYWKFCIPLCLPLIFHGISGVICASSDRIMIQKMIGLTAVGVYALAYNFSNIMDSVWGALHNSWDPFFFEYVKNGELDELKNRSKNYIRLYTCLAIGFIMLTPEVFSIFASAEYQEGVTVIPVVVLSCYAIFVYAFAANYELCFKRTDIMAIGSSIAGVANIGLNLIFINLMGYFGAAVATALSNVLLAIIHIVFAKRLAKEKWVYDIKMFFWAIIGLSIAITLFYICFDLWIVRWVYASVIGTHMIFKIYQTKKIF